MYGMREYSGLVTRKGQVTIPAEVRRELGIKEGDRVSFRMEDGGVHIIRRGSVAERTAGMFKSNEPPLSAQELRELAEQAIAEEAMRRSRM
jgi:AbrB family looped-hinge helix DNA binding protein